MAANVLEEWDMMEELIDIVFTPSDIDSLTPKVKQMGITYTAQAMSFYLRSFSCLFQKIPYLYQVCSCSADEEKDTELQARLWKKADVTFAKAASLFGNTSGIDFKWARLLYKLAKNSTGTEATSYLSRADTKYKMLAEFSPNSKIFAGWGRLHLLWSNHPTFSSWVASSRQVFLFLGTKVKSKMLRSSCFHIF